MDKFTQLKNQIEKLQREAEAVRERDRAETISKIMKAIVVFELTAEDLGLSRKKRNRPSKIKAAGLKRRGRPSKEVAQAWQPNKRTIHEKPILPPGGVIDRRSVVAAKYRDPASGNSWTGRGKQPKWVVEAVKNGRKLEDFKI